LKSFKVRLERLSRLAKGDNRDYAPMSPILLLFRFRVKLERLTRFATGYNRDYAPISPIWLSFRFRIRLELEGSYFHMAYSLSMV